MIIDDLITALENDGGTGEPVLAQFGDLTEKIAQVQDVLNNLPEDQQADYVTKIEKLLVLLSLYQRNVQDRLIEIERARENSRHNENACLAYTKTRTRRN